MMRTMGRMAIVCALVALGAASSEGQTLGQAAQTEAARRARQKETGKVITNDDLKLLAPARATPDAKGVNPVAPADAAAAVPSAADAKPAEKPETPPAATEQQPEPVKARLKRDEEHWRERAKVIRDRLDRLRADAMAIESRIASLQLELQSATPETAPALTSEIDQATKDLARFNKELRLIEGEWRAFEDRAREARIPQTWIR